jgi:hypothetical protein
MKQSEIGELHDSVETLEREIAILTSKYIVVTNVPVHELDKYCGDAHRIGREVYARLKKLHELTGNEIYSI